MRQRIPPVRRPSRPRPWLVVAAFLLIPTGAAAQSQANGLAGQLQDARIPNAGQLWLEISPTFQNWSEQFALDSPDPEIADGQKEPIHNDFDGLIHDRLYPAFAPILADLNADAEALGFDPIATEDFSLGRNDFATINRQIRRIDLGIEVGILSRLSVELRAPLVQSEVESIFVFDSATSSMVTGSTTLTDPIGFFAAYDGAQTALQALIDGGTLSPGEEAIATALLADSDGFRQAFERRVSDNLILPAGATAQGGQMTAFYEGLVAGYDGFGLTLPGFDLPQIAGRRDMIGYFTAPPVSGRQPTSVTRGWGIAEIEAGVRFKILDGFAGSGPAIEARSEAEAAAGEAGAPGEAAAQDIPALPTFRWRTTVGAKLRIPMAPADEPPGDDPADFVDLAISDGQPDVELALYQDLAIKRFLFVSGVARFGLQLADELTARVSAPDQPYAFSSVETTLRRDLGDYLWIRLSPQYRFTKWMSFAVDYTFWTKGSDSYQVVDGEAGIDPSPLELETSQTRHRLGFGILFRLDPDPGLRPPWLFGFAFRPAIAGSGGRTPAAQIVAVTFRVPIQF